MDNVNKGANKKEADSRSSSASLTPPCNPKVGRGFNNGTKKKRETPEEVRQRHIHKFAWSKWQTSPDPKTLPDPPEHWRLGISVEEYNEHKLKQSTDFLRAVLKVKTEENE